MSKLDNASKQLLEYKKRHQHAPVLTSRRGAPMGQDYLDNTNLSIIAEELENFNRERKPPRVAHAKGGGAFGYFKVTHDITKYSRASVFSHIGKKTPVAVRFSTSAFDIGTSDAVRDIRGFAVKFYAEDGNWDVVGANQPVFLFNDPILFPGLARAARYNPVTNLPDPNMILDYVTLRPETMHSFILLFTDRGTPYGFRHMHGHGINTFQLVNAKRVPVMCKFHFKTNQGIKNLTAEEALNIKDPDYAIRDLYNTITGGHYPSWTLSVQVMTYEQAKIFRWSPFDTTKVWPFKEFPLIEVGQVVLDRAPKNFYTEIEQLAFCPSNLIDGIEPTQEPILQARMIAYVNAQRYRLGVNFDKLPVNAPYRTVVHDYKRDGFMNFTDNGGDGPNYFPNSFNGPVPDKRYDLVNVPFTPDPTKMGDNFSQVTTFWNEVLKENDRAHLVENLATVLKDSYDFIQERAIGIFYQIHPDLGVRVKEALNRQKTPSKY